MSLDNFTVGKGERPVRAADERATDEADLIILVRTIADGRHGGSDDSQFLGEFSLRRHLPCFPGGYDSTYCDIPPSRPDVLRAGSPVDEQLTVS